MELPASPPLSTIYHIIFLGPDLESGDISYKIFGDMEKLADLPHCKNTADFRLLCDAIKFGHTFDLASDEYHDFGVSLLDIMKQPFGVYPTFKHAFERTYPFWTRKFSPLANNSIDFLKFLLELVPANPLVTDSALSLGSPPYVSFVGVRLEASVWKNFLGSIYAFHGATYTSECYFIPFVRYDPDFDKCYVSVLYQVGFEVRSVDVTTDRVGFFAALAWCHGSIFGKLGMVEIDDKHFELMGAAEIFLK